jgi:hypothetical protein
MGRITVTTDYLLWSVNGVDGAVTFIMKLKLLFREKSLPTYSGGVAPI